MTSYEVPVCTFCISQGYLSEMSSARLDNLKIRMVNGTTDSSRVSNRLLYWKRRFARPVFLFFSCFSTLGVCSLTLPAQARDQWTLTPSIRASTVNGDISATLSFSDYEVITQLCSLVVDCHMVNGDILCFSDLDLNIINGLLLCHLKGVSVLALHEQLHGCVPVCYKFLKFPLYGTWRYLWFCQCMCLLPLPVWWSCPLGSFTRLFMIIIPSKASNARIMCGVEFWRP